MIRFETSDVDIGRSLGQEKRWREREADVIFATVGTPPF